jgi:hypothetical protein
LKLAVAALLQLEEDPAAVGWCHEAPCAGCAAWGLAARAGCCRSALEIRTIEAVVAGAALPYTTAVDIHWSTQY